MDLTRLRELFSYDPVSGIVTRLSTGRPCGARHSNARPYLRINAGELGMLYAHRVAFALYHGYVPLNVDHADCDMANNTINNLRDCSHAENLRNQQKRHAPTSSKFKGVHFETQTARWRAEIKVNGHKLRLGRFDSEQEAARAYDRAAETCHAEFARLNNA